MEENRAVEAAAEEIARATAKSKQPRLTASQQAMTIIYQNILRWSKDALMSVSARSKDNRARDEELARFYKQEPLLSGVITSIVSIDKNRGWELVGGRNQVNRYSRILRNVESSHGWRYFASLQSESYWSQDVGAIAEIGRVGRNGPLGTLWHVDSSKIALTGKPKEPLKYYPTGYKQQTWGPRAYMQAVSMPSPQEELAEVGYCSVSRAMDLAIIMVAIYRHDREMLQNAMQKGLLLMQGIDDEAWESAMTLQGEQLTQREQEYFGGVGILFGDADLDAKMIRLSALPENFDLTEFTNVLMYGYALCVGYDAREFWPVSQGALGTGQETELQAIKASGKGGLDFALAFQDNLQRELPASLHFEFEQRNEAGLIAEAESIMSYAEAVNSMSESPLPGDETLTREERRQLYAARGYIPEEWTFEEEKTSATDTESGDPDQEPVKEMKERLLDQERVRWACRQYPDDPIIRYQWPSKRQVVLWDSGSDALSRKSFPAVKRQDEDDDPILFEGDDVIIRESDVDRAERNWNRRQEDEFEGLLSATLVEEE